MPVESTGRMMRRQHEAFPWVGLQLFAVGVFRLGTFISGMVLVCALGMVRSLFIVLYLGWVFFGQAAVNYNRDVLPILVNKCFACHGTDQAKRKAGLPATSLERPMTLPGSCRFMSARAAMNAAWGPP